MVMSMAKGLRIVHANNCVFKSVKKFELTKPNLSVRSFTSNVGLNILAYSTTDTWGVDHSVIHVPETSRQLIALTPPALKVS